MLDQSSIQEQKFNVFEVVLGEAGLLTERTQELADQLMDEVLSVGGTELAARRGESFQSFWDLPAEHINGPVGEAWLDLDDHMAAYAAEVAISLFGKGLMGYQANMFEALMGQIKAHYEPTYNAEFNRLLDVLVERVVDAKDDKLSQRVMGLIEERRAWETTEQLVLFERGVKLHKALVGVQRAMLVNGS